MSEEKTKLEQLEESLKSMDQVQPLDSQSDSSPRQGDETPAPTTQEQTPADPVEVPEPAETPSPDPEKTEQPTADDLLENDVAHPQAEHFRKLREVAKGFKFEASKLREEIEQLKASRSPEPASQEPQAQASAQRKLSPDDVIMAVARARNNELDGREENVLRDARIVMEHEFSPVEIKHILDRAKRGEYGRYSDDIKLFMDEALPEILVARQAAEQEQVSEFRQNEQRVTEYRASVEQSSLRVAEKYPELKNPESEMRRYMNRFLEENVGHFSANGILEKPGPLASVLANANWPEVIAPIAARMYELEKTRVVNAPSAEPTGSRGRGVSQGQTGKTRLDTLEDTIRSMGKVEAIA